MLIHLGACVVLHHPQKIVFLNACRALLHSVSQLAPPLHEWVLHLVFHFSSGLGQVWKPLQSASFAPFVEGSEHSAFRFSTQSRRRATPRGRPLCVRATSHMFSRLAEYRESLNSAWRAASALCNQEANGRILVLRTGFLRVQMIEQHELDLQVLSLLSNVSCLQSVIVS